MAREREITITLDPALWPEYQRRLAAAVAELGFTRGASTRAINLWLLERAGSQLPAQPAATPIADDDLYIDLSKDDHVSH